MRMRIDFASLLTVILLIAPAASRGERFDGCGILVQGPGCMLFSTGASDLFQLDYYGPFHVWDTVLVSGSIVTSCDPSCPGAEACISVDTLTSCGTLPPPMTPFDGCGVVVQGSGCLLFHPLYPGSPEVCYLDEYGQFGAGDTVHVSGMLDLDCHPPCPGAFGCIHNDSIRPCYRPPHIPFQAHGILVQGAECMMIAPGGQTQSLFHISEYGGFAAGDTVFVTGSLVPDSVHYCPESDGFVLVDSIYSAGQFGTRLPGNFVMKTAPGADVEEILNAIGAQVLDSIRTEDTYLVSFADSFLMETVLDSVATHEGVEYAEPNFEAGVPENMQMSISFPDEEAPAYVRYSSPSRFYGQEASTYVDIDSAHQLTLGEGVVVAVIDNGFDLTHPLLVNSIEPGGYDFLDDDPNPGVDPDSGSAIGHGTFVAGLILLVSPDSRILPLRAFGNDGIGSSFAVSSAIYYAIDHGAEVINMSFGQYEFSNALQMACSSAAAAGVLMVAAGGNDGMYLPIFPAALQYVIGVSALDSLDAIAYFSNFGDYVDVCAPGYSVYSSLFGLYDWGVWSGTSFSTALVTGVCALAKSVDPQITSARAETLIQQTADRSLESGVVVPPDLFYGYGRVNAASAVWTLSSQGSTICGDADASGEIDIDDAVFIISYVFASGPEPTPLSIGDVDLSGMIDIDDITYLITFIFLGGAAPCSK